MVRLTMLERLLEVEREAWRSLGRFALGALAAFALCLVSVWLCTREWQASTGLHAFAWAVLGAINAITIVQMTHSYAQSATDLTRTRRRLVQAITKARIDHLPAAALLARPDAPQPPAQGPEL